jgi:hypothetical protein
MQKNVVRYWIGVASKEHVQHGRLGGFAQFCHGKLNPVKSLAKDDWIIYYSGKEKFSEAKACRKFTAIVVFRALVLTGLPGLVFGVLYRRCGLEAAIVSHFLTDLVIHLLPTLFI